MEVEAGMSDNPQPALRPVLAQCATPCARVSVCMGGAWLLSYRQCMFTV